MNTINMEWGFLDIFKKAEFNSLMVAVAITGWIMYYFQIEKLIFGLACFASIYCITRFVVFCYQRIVGVRSIKKSYKQEQLAKELNGKKYEEKKKMEINRMFNGLSDVNKFYLSSLILNGKTDPYYYNILHFDKYSKESMFLDTLLSVTEIFKDGFGVGKPTLTIKDYGDAIAVTIDSYLYELTKQYIEKTNNQ